MHAHEATAGGDEFEKVLAAFGFGNAAADGVVQKHRVELAERLAVKHCGVFADAGVEGSRPFPELFEGLTACENRCAVAVVFNIPIEDQQAARFQRLDAGLGGQCFLDATPLRGVRHEGFLGGQ